MIELSVIRDLVAIFGVVAGFSYYVLTVRNNQRNQRQQLETRQTQLFMQFTEKIRDNQEAFTEMREEWSWNNYDDFMQKYGPEANPDEWWKFITLAGLFEQMGVLAKEGSVNVQIIYDWIGSYPIRLWDKFEEIIDGYRIEREAPPKGMWMEYFEDLVYMLREIRVEDIRDLDNRLKRRKTQRQEIGRTMPDYS